MRAGGQGSGCMPGSYPMRSGTRRPPKRNRPSPIRGMFGDAAGHKILRVDSARNKEGKWRRTRNSILLTPNTVRIARICF